MRTKKPKVYFENSWSPEFKRDLHNKTRGDRPMRHRKRKRIKHKHCLHCRKAFDTYCNWQTYCCKACVAKAALARRRERDETMFYIKHDQYIMPRFGYNLCQHCKKKTFPAWRKENKYCSRRCSELAAYERRKARLADPAAGLDHRTVVRDPDCLSRLL